MKANLFSEIGGRETLQKVHRVFYDKIYADPWIGQFFAGIDQKVIEDQQTDFMSQTMGGPAVYAGAFPAAAHKHMNISEELFLHRQMLLKESLEEASVAPELAWEWLRLDEAFRKGIVKGSLSDCQKRFPTDTILSFERPQTLKKAS